MKAKKFVKIVLFKQFSYHKMSLNNPFVVGNLSVLGSIQFSDQSIQSSSNTNLTDRVLGITRDSLNGITSINSDNFVVEKTVSVNEKLTTPNILLQNATFMNDYDGNGLPIIQSKGFSDELRQKLLTAKDTIDAIIPDIIEPPLKKAKLNSAEFVSNSNAISINDFSINIENLNGTSLTTLEPNFFNIRSGATQNATIYLDLDGNLLLNCESGNFIFNQNVDFNDKNLINISSIWSSTSDDIDILAVGTRKINFHTAGNQRMSINEFGIINFPIGSINTSTGVITASLSGVSSHADNVKITSSDTATTCFPILASSTGTGYKNLLMDDSLTPLNYTPSSGNLTCNTVTSTLLGYASQLYYTSDNTSGTYYIPFVKTGTSGGKVTFIDDATGPLTYNPSTSTLTATTFSGSATNANNVNITTTTTTNATHYINFSAVTTGNNPVRADTSLMYNPSTNTITTERVDATIGVRTPIIQNATGDVTLQANTTGVGGKIIFTGGTDLISATTGGNSGNHLSITINGTAYKIALLLP